LPGCRLPREGAEGRVLLHNSASGGDGLDWRGYPPPLSDPDFMVRKNEILQKEILIWLFLVHKLLGSRTPPPLKENSVDTTKTRSDPQRVRMSSGERPIGAAKGKQPKTEALCQPRPPLCQACLGREAATRLPLSFPQLPTAHGTKGLSTRSQGVQCSRREQGAKHPAAPLTFPCPDHHTIMKHDPFGPEENRMQMGRHAF